MEEDNEYCEKHCKGYRDTGGRCFFDGRCDAYREYQKQKETMNKDLKAAVKVKAITYEGDDIFSLDTNYGTIKAKTLNPFSTDEEKEVICTAMPSAITKKQKEAIKLLNYYQWYTKECDGSNGMDDNDYFLLLECIMGKYQ